MIKDYETTLLDKPNNNYKYKVFLAFIFVLYYLFFFFTITKLYKNFI